MEFPDQIISPSKTVIQIGSLLKIGNLMKIGNAKIVGPSIVTLIKKHFQDFTI